MEKASRDLSARGHFCHEYLSASHYRNDLCPERSRSDDRASLLQPCRADAIAGDHLRKKDIGWDIGNECCLCEGDTQSAHRGERWSWLLCIKAAWSPDGRIYLHDRRGSGWS